MDEPKNVLGGELETCSKFPMTGYMRDGYCQSCSDDVGMHTVCIELTEDFLKFSFEVGNDLSTPIPDFDFPGLIPGDRWCLCALRWKEAFDAGVPPRVYLQGTHMKTLEVIPLEDLKKHAVDDQTTDPTQSL